ncbi:urease accessory protein UreE [Alicyclobacillus cellulosilyticus]|uniref:Urease accessory protein UreE n=1 Tax=Alicyclobacillus cellulosilyticus TaxID=1003997 RepID=A0A917K679_9BACL|nr:urease accessory protein UreE [Alicyclobacillus cellulosilyticus]GGI99486.1 urease accessory protein UreE [Alicyclobacillus cellulosilyticus]
MILEARVGHVSTHPLDGRTVERIRLSSHDLAKRLLRVTTDAGREVGIRLPEGTELRDGDILWMDDRVAIVIDVLPEELLVVGPRSLREMGEVAHQLGNRHIPVQFADDLLLVQYDYLVERLLQELEVPYRRETRKVARPFRHVGHHHAS